MTFDMTCQSPPHRVFAEKACTARGVNKVTDFVDGSSALNDTFFGVMTTCIDNIYETYVPRCAASTEGNTRASVLDKTPHS